MLPVCWYVLLPPRPHNLNVSFVLSAACRECLTVQEANVLLNRCHAVRLNYHKCGEMMMMKMRLGNGRPFTKLYREYRDEWAQQ